ncbi:TonB-dependent receptor [Sphingobacterium kyonggiense]
MKQIYFTLLLLFCTTCLFAQKANIKGIVHLLDGKPVSNATIRVEGSPILCVSNEKGEYILNEVPYGKQVILVTSLEIKNKKVSLKVDRPVHDLHIHIDPKGNISLDEVRVVRNTEKKEIETKGFAVNVIETKEAALRNLQTNELLDKTVGVRVRMNGGLGSTTSYNLNGMTGNSVRILIDGIPVSTFGSSFNLNSIPPALIERIEVYKGVIPAHLSDDALGGAINVVLKKGKSNNLNASVSYGSFNTTQSNLSGMYRSKNSGFTVKGSAFYNYSDNDYEVWGKFVRNILPNGRYVFVKAKRFNDAYKSYGGRIELGYTDVKWADQFFIGYNGSDDYNEIQHGAYMSIPYKGRFSKSNAHVGSLSYAKKNLFVEGLEFTVNAMYSMRNELVSDTVSHYYNWFGEQSFGLDGKPIYTSQGAQQGPKTLNHIDRNTLTARAGLTYQLNNQHQFILNNIFYDVDRDQRDDMRSVLEREFIGTRDLQKNVLSLAYENQLINGKLRSTVFGKYYQQNVDRMDPTLVTENGESVKKIVTDRNTKSTTGYGLALSYAFNPTIMLLTSAEKAVRMPTEGEVFGSPGENIIENFGIRPEISNNLNLGFRLGPFAQQNHRFSITGSGFLRNTKDKIARRINSRINDVIQTEPFENIGKTQSVGFETELKYQYKDLQVFFNLSRFNTLFKMKYDQNGKVFEQYNQQIPNEPFFTANAGAQYGLKDVAGKGSNLSFYYGAGFVESFYTTSLVIEDFKTPRQFIQDLGASYLFPNKRYVLSIDAKNILNKQAYDNFAVQKPGRAFYIKLNYNIHNF